MMNIHIKVILTIIGLIVFFYSAIKWPTVVLYILAVCIGVAFLISLYGALYELYEELEHEKPNKKI